MSPFDGEPAALYVPAGSRWRVTAESDLELAVCTAPGKAGARPARAIRPENLSKETRGKGTNTRYVTNILPEDQPADSLLVVEVIAPGGHTSSYPPHKHDQDNLPEESLLEETYYHRMSRPQGFAFQRVYTDADENGDRSLDETMAVEDGDVVMVPKGYHPCAACYGYDQYRSQRHGRPQAHLAFQQRQGARVAVQHIALHHTGAGPPVSARIPAKGHHADLTSTARRDSPTASSICVQPRRA